MQQFVSPFLLIYSVLLCAQLPSYTFLYALKLSSLSIFLLLSANFLKTFSKIFSV